MLVVKELRRYLCFEDKSEDSQLFFDPVDLR